MRFTFIIPLLLLAACGSMPTHSKLATSDAPAVNVSDSPIGTKVFANNILIGTVTEELAKFTAPSGTVSIRITNPFGETVFNQEVFLTKNVERFIPTK